MKIERIVVDLRRTEMYGSRPLELEIRVVLDDGAAKLTRNLREVVPENDAESAFDYMLDRAFRQMEAEIKAANAPATEECQLGPQHFVPHERTK